uniref:Uncharacterized protein n=2 Tax=Sus scrofa TaxID=9823 RepID=A0A8D0RTN5_PIG
ISLGCSSCRVLGVAAPERSQYMALRKGGNEVDLARIPRSHTHSRAFLSCSRRCYLITWGQEQRRDV